MPERLPVLAANGVVDFHSPEDYHHHFGVFLSQGALMVLPRRVLDPFAVIDLRLDVPGRTAHLRMKAQVTCTSGEATLLTLTDLDVPTRRALEEAARASAPRVTPAPAPAEPVAPPTQVPAVPPADPSQGPAAPSLAATLQIPPADPSQVPATPPALPGPAPTAPSFQLPPEGELINPRGPKEFLALPLAGPPPAGPLILSVPLLMRWFASQPTASFLWQVRIGGRDLELAVVRGDLESTLPIEAATRALAEEAGSYRVTPAPVEPRLRHRTGLLQASFAVLKEMLKRFPEPALAAAMSGRLGDAPRPTDRGRALLRGLGLSDAQLRMARRMLDGDLSLHETMDGGVGARSSWQVIYLLQVLGGLEWLRAPPRRDLRADELQATLIRVRGQDHFAALGLHLSSSPRSVERALETMRATFGPGGTARQTSEETAAAIWERMSQAYAAVRTPEGRRAYRQQAFPGARLDYAAAIVRDQASLAVLRNELDLAVDLLTAAVELDPKPEYAAELRRLSALSTARPASKA